MPFPIRLFSVLLFSLALLFPSAAAQLVSSPSSIERTLPAGESATATLTLSNPTGEAARFGVVIADSAFVPLTGNPIGDVRDASDPRMAPFSFYAGTTDAALSSRRALNRILVDGPALMGRSAGVGAPSTALRGGTSASDSLFYDNGDDYPDAFFGTGEVDERLFVAQRFTPDAPFTLDGARLALTTGLFDHEGEGGASDLSITVEVYEAPDPEDPRAGALLGTISTGFNAGFDGFAEVPFNQNFSFATGESFFLVVSLVGTPFPIGVDLSGTNDAPGRSLYSRTGESGAWTLVEAVTGELASPFVIRAHNGSSTRSGWLSATPASGEIPPGASVDLALTIDATRLNAGTYRKVVQVFDSVTGEVLTVPVSLTVDGAGSATLAPSSVSFDEVLVGTISGRTIFLVNEGTAPLTVTGITSFDPALFLRGLDVGDVVEPRNETAFAVTFVPRQPGRFDGSIVISTDAGDVAVDVRASAVAPPSVQVSQRDLAATLAPGDAATLPLTISNSGGGRLLYSAALENPDGSPSGFVQDSIFYDTGDSFPDALLGSGNADEPLSVAQRFTADRPFSLNAVRLFASTFNIEHDPDAPEPDSSFSPLTLTVEVYDVADATDPTGGTLRAAVRTILNEPIADFVTVTMESSLDLSAGDDVFVVVRYDGVAFPIGIDDMGISEADGRGFLSRSGLAGDWSAFPDYFDVGSPSVPLLRALSLDASGLVVTADPTSGIIPPGASATVNVRVDATDAERGVYSRALVLRTNDPAQPEVRVPVQITVEGSNVMPLTEGWNLISWNVALDDLRIEAALASVWDQVEAVRAYRDGVWLTYASDGGPNTSESDPLERMVEGEAVWVKLSAPARLTMDGAPVSMASMALTPGLNAVAYLPTNVDGVANAFASILDAAEGVQSFHSTGVTYAPDVPDAFQTLGRVRPGMGYQVRVTSPVRLDYPLVAAPAEVAGIPADALVAAERVAGVTPTPSWISVWGQALSGLTTGTLVTALDPDGVTSGAFTVQADGALGLMAIYADDPTTARDEGAEPGDAITLRTPDGVLTDALVWTEAGAVTEVQGFVVSNEGAGSQPTAFALRGTYPNPFTSSTTVAFDLPEAADVTLEVYDATGRRVATLSDTALAAGSHTMRWDATSAASGVYLMALRAGDNRATRTVVLAR
ncbi:MAG: choice-of-anchor D domain-containing protein [Bacteroidota bacterium]